MTTIRDVAKYAGVSPITVSRVVNDADNVNPDTRARVEKAITELGYIPNLAARSLRSKQSFTLALILPDITSTFWTTVARGAEDAAQGGGYSVFLCNTDENPTKFTKYINTVIRQRVDGVLIAPYSMDGRQLSQLGGMNIPTVVIDRRVNHWEGDSVYCDSVAGAHALVQHLLSLGHRRIAILSGPVATSTAEDRVTGYCLALRKAGIPIDERLILRGEYRESSGITLTRELIESHVNPTAIIAANNAIAAGVLEQLKILGLGVPDDIAVVCFDEMQDMERRFPFMTNVTQPAYDMGVNATQLLLSRISANGSLRPREVILPTRLILRYSCGRFLKNEGSESQIRYSILPDVSESVLVKPLDDADRDLLLSLSPANPGFLFGAGLEIELAKPNKERLTKALAFQQTDRLAILENRGVGAPIMEHVLGRSIRMAPDGLNVLPEDLVEFAQKMGLDAVPCDISWNLGPVSSEADVDLVARARQLYPPPSLAVQISTLENLLNAVEGTGVGVYVRFSSFVQNALSAVSENDLRAAIQRHPAVNKLMDMLVKHQSRVMRALCDRFGRDLSFVSIQDDLLASERMASDLDLFETSILPHLDQMCKSAKEHDIPIALDTLSLYPAALSRLYESGVRIIQSSGLESAPLTELSREWSGKVVFMGGIPAEILSGVSKEAIEDQIQQICEIFKAQPGFVLSVDASLSDFPGLQPQNFVTLIRSVQRYGQNVHKLRDSF